MALFIVLPEFFVDLDCRIHTGGIVIDNGKILDAGDHVLNMQGEKLRLRNQVIMPGFVNGHSHAFQRLLRGLVERKPKASLKQNFFTWREKMYTLAQSLTESDLTLVANFVFHDMLLAGFTHVAEFHYLHHELGEDHARDPLALSRAMANGAASQKINLTLLECAYQRSNFDEPLRPEQQRFGFRSARDFLAFFEEAARGISNAYTKIGVAIHSVRAVDETWFNAINDRARAHHAPLHLHVSEQRAEIDACVKARGLSPIALLDRYHLLAPHTTLVHATHLIQGDHELLANSGTTICVCPSTEKNLGDGVIELAGLMKTLAICIGTDQHVRLDPFEELRSLEEQERARIMQRLVLNHEGQYLFEALLPSLTRHGLRALDPRFHNEGLIGIDANLVGVALPPEYLWHGPKAALDALLLAGNSSSIRTVISRGEPIVFDGIAKNRDHEYFVKEIGKFFRKLNLV